MKTWDLQRIIEETGELHIHMDSFLTAYINGSKSHETAYLNTLKRMEGNRPAYVIEYYQHCYNGAKNVVELNEHYEKMNEAK